jgi:hypothetical protein
LLDDPAQDRALVLCALRPLYARRDVLQIARIGLDASQFKGVRGGGRPRQNHHGVSVGAAGTPMAGAEIDEHAEPRAFLLGRPVERREVVRMIDDHAQAERRASVERD